MYFVPKIVPRFKDIVEIPVSMSVGCNLGGWTRRDVCVEVTGGNIFNTRQLVCFCFLFG